MSWGLLGARGVFCAIGFNEEPSEGLSGVSLHVSFQRHHERIPAKVVTTGEKYWARTSVYLLVLGVALPLRAEEPVAEGVATAQEPAAVTEEPPAPGEGVRAREHRWVVALETGFSLAEPSIVVGGEVGVRTQDWSILLEVDWNPFISISSSSPVVAGVLNIGAGLERIYAGGLLRSAFFFGTSTLLYRTAFDAPGTTGVFADLIPISIRLPLAKDRLTLRVDPISMHLIAPVLSGLPFLRYEYRHAVSIELTP